MSVYSLKLPFLQISPTVWTDDDRLCARTSKIYRILNLCFYSRTIIIDKVKKKIEITNRTFWFIKSIDYISFDDLKYVDISDREVGSEFGITPDGFGAQDITEIYYVQIIKKSTPFPVNLFRFIGDGGRHTGWFGVLLGDSAIDSEGNQQQKAYAYAEQVSKFTNIPLWRDRKVEFSFDNAEQFNCPKCGHVTSSSIKKCMYCGFQIKKKEQG